MQKFLDMISKVKFVRTYQVAMLLSVSVNAPYRMTPLVRTPYNQEGFSQTSQTFTQKFLGSIINIRTQEVPDKAGQRPFKRQQFCTYFYA